MASQALLAPFYPAIKESKVLVKAGETKIPGDIIAGKESVVQSIGIMYGWIIAESTGTAPAKIRIWDGTGGEGTGNYIGTVTLAENESNREWFGRDGPPIMKNAIYVEVVSGKVEGSISYA